MAAHGAPVTDTKVSDKAAAAVANSGSGGTAKPDIMPPTSAPSPSAAAAAASSQSATTTATFGPLPSARTITMTMVPDWNQEAIRSPLRPATLSVVIGPANTTPEQAKWVFTMNLYAMDQHRGSSKKPDEEAIGKGSRALLWYDGKPFARYHHAVEPDECRLPPNDDLKTVSIVLRTFSEEKDPNALVYVRRRYGVTRSQGAGYLKIVQGHHYYLNITFAAGSMIAKMVGQYGWRPMVYLNPRGPGERREIDPANPTKGLLIFANFVTNWAQGVELVPDERELRLAAQARVQDTNDEDRSKTAAAPPPSVIAAGAAPRIFGNLVGSTVPRIDPSMTVAVPPEAGVPPRQTPTAVVFNIPTASSSALAQAALQQQLYLQTAAQKVAESISAGHTQAVPAISGLQKQTPFQYALSPMTIHGPPLDTTLVNPNPGDMTYLQLEWQINTIALPMVQLPSLDSKTYAPDFPLDANVARFYRSDESALAPAMMAMESIARPVSLDPKHPAHTQTKHLLSFFVSLNQVLGWQHVQRYVEAPLQYAEGAKFLLYGGKHLVIAGSSSSLASQSIRSMDVLQERGQRLMRKLCHRMDWILELQRNSNRPFDAELSIKVVAADREWATEADLFMKEAEHKIVEMLHPNQERFQQFREMQRRGVGWPHSAQLRSEIEAAGFFYRPMMLKRDRCVCDECGVEVTGWKPWHSPLSFHIYERHKIKPPANLLHEPNSPAISQMVTEANRRHAMALAAPPVLMAPVVPSSSSASAAVAAVKTAASTTASLAATNPMQSESGPPTATVASSTFGLSPGMNPSSVAVADTTMKSS